MADFYNLSELALPPSVHVARASWTAIIHDVGSRPAAESSPHKRLAWCAERLEPFCHHMAFVVPHGSDVLVRPVLENLMNGPFKLIGQREPLGVGQALALCQTVVKTPRVIVMEAGETALADEAMFACVTLAKQNPDAQLIVPMLVTDQGETGCGTFFFKSAALFRGLRERDQNLLSLMPSLDNAPGAVIVLRIKESDLRSA
jgi:hypothetical protein